VEVSGQLHAAVALSSRKQPAVSVVYKAGWATEPFWTLRRREDSVALAGNRIPIPRASSPPRPDLCTDWAVEAWTRSAVATNALTALTIRIR
jgi:hypothetical protein